MNKCGTEGEERGETVVEHRGVREVIFGSIRVQAPQGEAEVHSGEGGSTLLANFA